MRTIRAATDVGGTFTDLVYFVTDPETGAQEVSTAKVDTTPPDFERGVMNVIAKSGVALEDVAFMAHGTTVVINAVTERNGVVAGLITSEGFRDVLEIAREIGLTSSTCITSSRRRSSRAGCAGSCRGP